MKLRSLLVVWSALALALVLTLALSSFQTATAFLSSSCPNCKAVNNKNNKNKNVVVPFQTAKEGTTIIADSRRLVQSISIIAAAATTTKSTSDDEENDTHDDDDALYIRRDEAKTTLQLLKGIWQQIAQGNSMLKGVR